MSPLLKPPGRVIQGLLFVVFLAIAGIFGYLHAQVGQEIVFAVFYLFPVAGATWFVGRTAGIAMAGICGIVALGATLASGQVFSAEWIPVFNALVICGFFIITAYALAHLRTALQHEARLAREDILTSIPNLRSFQEQMPVRVRDAAGQRQPMTLGLVDLSDIGYINDRWGTQAGDHLLRVTAHTLQELLRPDDLLFRVGGTTFAVVLPGLSHQEAHDYLERLRGRMLSELERFDRPVSVAIAAVSAEKPSHDPDELLGRTGTLLRTLKLERTANPFRVVSDVYVA
jgi:diguanylate cyclase (GGDEF)-like protein